MNNGSEYFCEWWLLFVAIHSVCLAGVQGWAWLLLFLVVVAFLTLVIVDIKESRNISNLHKQIKACDGILEVSRCRFMI